MASLDLAGRVRGHSRLISYKSVEAYAKKFGLFEGVKVGHFNKTRGLRVRQSLSPWTDSQPASKHRRELKIRVTSNGVRALIGAPCFRTGR
jgi:hypothetical protein